MRFRLPAEGLGLPPAPRHDPCEILFVRRCLSGDATGWLGRRRDSTAQRQFPQGFAHGASTIQAASRPLRIGPFGLFGRLELLGNFRVIGVVGSGHRLGG